MEIIKLSAEHTAQVHRVLSDAFSSPWSEDTVRALLQSSKAVCFGAFDGTELVGYAALEWVLDEGSLTDIAVLRTHRGRGIGRMLMNELLKAAREQMLRFVTLEVRETNTPAINLYASFGFEQVGKRPRYYSDPVEDALLLTKYMDE